MMKVQVIQGAIPAHYHVLPSDLGRITISPERDAIFQHLARIGSDRFPEFVTDILVHVEGHTKVDVTDGPGDEKQDILTLDPAGRRFLTQTKHTSNPAGNSSGDELDLLFSACFRKNCSTGLYVTNADLTPQAKRYVTDKEFARGYTGAVAVPDIDYWTGPRIWERVARSNAILNKWFSGMAQVHALRRFYLDLVITRMPTGTPCPLDVQALAARLGESFSVARAEDGRSFDVRVDARLTMTISDGFRSPAELGMTFLLPEGEFWHPQMPLRTIRVHALLSEEAGGFDIAAVRDRIAVLFSDALPNSDAESWWHVLSTGPQAFVFVHDIAKPVPVRLDDPRAFVRVGERATAPELKWAAQPGKVFVRRSHPEDPEDIVHVDETTHTTVRILIEEPVEPLAAFDFHLRQERIKAELQKHTFRAVRNADWRIIETIRRLCDFRWFVLHASNNDVFWAYPPDAEPTAVGRLEAALHRRGIEVQRVSEETIPTILGYIDTTPGKFGGLLTAVDRAVATPLALERRIFWLTRDVPFDARATRDHFAALVSFKAEYEARHGFDLFGGNTAVTFAGEEVRALLFDPISMRGSRMLDIDLSKGTASLHFRAREGSVLSAEELAISYARELDDLSREIKQCLAGVSLDAGVD
jgi:hypothetical protein